MRPITVRIACVQLEARASDHAAAALDDALAGIAASASRGAQIAVLPECTYPGYVLLAARRANGRATERALAKIARAAKHARIAVCVGVARRGPDGKLRNEAVYIDRRGEEAARYAKLFLWNFDRSWFAAGDAVPTFDTEFGRLGMMICADGRMPEIARTMASEGAWLVLDPTAWVSFGGSYETMRNPQAEFMLRVRARENGLWIAAADKCGSEHGAVHYVGRSAIVAPDGAVVAAAGARSPAIVVADVERRPGSRPFVASLTPEERRALRRLRPLGAKARAPVFRLGVIQGPMRADRANAIAALRAQGVAAVVDTSSSAAAIGAAVRAIRGLHAATIVGRRMMAPEPARAAALRGADLVLWTTPPADAMCRDIARTRAIENRVYVLVCEGTRSASGACVIDPDGAVTAEAIAGQPSGFVAAIDAARARDKTIVPGADAFAARVPRAFALVDGARA